MRDETEWSMGASVARSRSFGSIGFAGGNRGEPFSVRAGPDWCCFIVLSFPRMTSSAGNERGRW